MNRRTEQVGLQMYPKKHREDKHRHPKHPGDARFANGWNGLPSPVLRHVPSVVAATPGVECQVTGDVKHPNCTMLYLSVGILQKLCTETKVWTVVCFPISMALVVVILDS